MLTLDADAMCQGVQAIYPEELAELERGGADKLEASMLLAKQVSNSIATHQHSLCVLTGSVGFFFPLDSLVGRSGTRRTQRHTQCHRGHR